ncbi:hypothetical protein [Nonomuraea typhae]|uniref:Uncharacterized protein n=1 Tax=Nonomuraea typhae TaxID=2603600 RepID=A0ABW7Z951_9ACTN
MLFRRLAATAAVALATLGLIPASADAARGELILLSGSAPIAVFRDPAGMGCYSTTTAFDTVTNRTDSHVFVYQDAACNSSDVTVVPPGQNPVFVGERRSVYVIH